MNLTSRREREQERSRHCPFPDKECKKCPFYQLRYAYDDDGKRATEAGKGAQYYECVWQAELKPALQKLAKVQRVLR